MNKILEFIKRLINVLIKVITKEQPPLKYRFIGPFNKNDLMIYVNQIIERSGNYKPEIELIYNKNNNINDENYSACILFRDAFNIKSYAYKTIQDQLAKLDSMMKFAGELYKENKILKGDKDNIIKIYEKVKNLLLWSIDVLLIFYKIESEENEIKIENALLESSKSLTDLNSYIYDLLNDTSQRNKSD